MQRAILSLLFVGVAVLADDTSKAALTLAPLIKKYQEYIYAGNYDDLKDLYDPHAVLVVVAKNKAFLGHKAIFDEIKDTRKKVGSAKSEFITESFTGSAPVLQYENTWKVVTDEIEYSGPYKAIWSQNKDGQWKIIHEEYAEHARRRK
ncbi:unnamed protein product, partial [Mesorhabditis belari]|uniref:DUF4440 domain-containing protein n=1 Tax=Mesorhabditis belari TaxID=2138241 RepID=A0AAF3ECC9_9BILA